MSSPPPDIGSGRVLVTGAAGLLGGHLVASAPTGVTLDRTWRRRKPPPEGRATDHQVELADPDAVQELFERVRPDVVIHAAYDKHDPERGIVAATRHVAAGAASVGAALVHVSSDVVFDGEHAPYDEFHPLCPITTYGAAKARAEGEAVAVVSDATIVRTSLLCAVSPMDPVTAWIVDALRRGEPITLFSDEVRLPARVDHVAARIWALCALDRFDRAGPWHLAGPEPLSRIAIGRLVADGVALDPEPLLTGRSADRADPRPRDLRLSVTRPLTPASPNEPIATLFDRGVDAH